MCSSPHWQVGLSWFREKLSPANREQRLSRWADFAKNCLPRIGSKELPRFREKYRALGRQKMGSNMRPRYIQFRDIRDRDISGLHCIMHFTARCSNINPVSIVVWQKMKRYCVLFAGQQNELGRQGRRPVKFYVNRQNTRIRVKTDRSDAVRRYQR